jgi:hypothetical protein
VDTTGFGIGTPIFLTPFAIERGTEPNLISAEIRSSETALANQCFSRAAAWQPPFPVKTDAGGIVNMVDAASVDSDIRVWTRWAT